MSESNPLRLLCLFSLPEDALARAREIAPGLLIHQTTREDPQYPQFLPQADIIVGWPPIFDLPKATRLRWLQLPSAGADHYAEALPPHVLLTTASGVFGIPIAEHVLAMMLALVRGINEAVRAAAHARWQQDVRPMELFGATCGIVGLGDIGTETARRAKAFGMRVIATKRTPVEKAPFVDELWDATGLDRLLAESDHVVVTLPGIRATRHMIDARRIALMKRGAFLYNVGRGSTIDEPALIVALRNGQLAGAGLDVFETEPLPPTSQLWSLPNVIVSPHRSGRTPRQGERLAAIFLRNLTRMLRNEPLENLVDRQWGY